MTQSTVAKAAMRCQTPARNMLFMRNHLRLTYQGCMATFKKKPIVLSTFLIKK